MLIGITLQTSSYSVLALKNLALGLGGVLYPLVPALAIWLGALLCISARHYVSMRSFSLGFALFLSFGAFLTLVTSITGFGTLMDYIHNMNTHLKPVAEPASFGSFMARAFEQYDKKLNPLPGGGALGMLVAFPVWRFLGQVGGLVFLALGILALAAALLGINPARIYQRMEQRRAQKPEPLAVQPQQEVQPLTPQSDAAPQPYQPQKQPYYVDPEPMGQAPQSYQPDPYVSEPFQPQPMEPEQLWSQPVQPQPELPWEEPAPEEQGFVSAAQDFFEDFGQPVQPVAQRGERLSRRQRLERQQPREDRGQALPVEPVKPDVKPVPVAAQPAPRVPEPAVEAKPQADPPPPVEPVKPAAQPHPRPSNAVRDVGVAPALPLSGERVAVQPRTELPQSQRRLDGTAKPTAPVQQSIQLDDYQRPPARLLTPPPSDERYDTTEEDTRRAEKLISTLASFNIPAEVQQIVHGPAITRFAIRLAEGVNVNRLRNVMDNLAVELLAKSAIRAEIPIPGTPLIGIEVSNDKTTTVFLSEVLQSQRMLDTKSPTAVALGKDITGAPIICELMDMPHLLIAGATGSGKSVCINSIITSLLYRATPRDVRLILVDPKFVELQPYNDVPHLLLPVVVDPKKAVAALDWVCQEMDERYQKLQKFGVRNIDAYNKRLDPQEEPMPRIVVIIDEMSDLMASAGKIIDEHVKRITAKARAAGICLILATQRPSVDVITGIIKANIPSRIAFQVSSQVDSRTILDSQGAEKLLGYGDMLYLPRMLPAPKRVQGCFISDKDVGLVTEYVKSRHQAEYNVDIMEHLEKSDRPEGGAPAADDVDSDEAFDELLPQAIEMAVEAGQMSISMLQRVLRVGYGRAGRLIDEMARRNIISGNEGTKARKTLITREEYQNLFGDEA